MKLATGLLLAALALGGATRAYTLAAPFGIGFDGWFGGMYGQGARNLARSGFLEMRLVPVFTSGPVRWGEVAPYLHHPPLVSDLVALSYCAFGVSEWSTRLAPSLCFLLAIGLFFALVRRVATEEVAGVAALALAALPMTAIYGGMFNFEPVVIAATTGTYLSYLRWRESGRPRDLALTLALQSVSILAGWFGAFVAVPIALHAVLAKPRARLWFVPLLGLAVVATVAALFVYFEWIWPGALSELAHQAKHRQSATRGDFTTGTYTLGDFFRRHWLYFRYNYTIAGLALAVAGPLLARLSGRPELRRGAAHAGLLAIAGILPVLAFPQASYQHAFLSFPLSLAIALGVALAGAALWSRPVPRVIAVLALGAFLFFAQRTTWPDLMSSHRDDGYRTLGLAIGAATPFEAGVATPGTDLGVWLPAGFYADRAITVGIDSLEKLDAARRAPRQRGAPVRYVVFTPPLYEAHRDFAAALAARYPAASDERILIFDVSE